MSYGREYLYYCTKCGAGMNGAHCDNCGNSPGKPDVVPDARRVPCTRCGTLFSPLYSDICPLCLRKT